MSNQPQPAHSPRRDRLAEAVAALAAKEAVPVRSHESIPDLLRRIVSARGGNVSFDSSYSDSVASLIEIYALNAGGDDLLPNPDADPDGSSQVVL